MTRLDAVAAMVSRISTTPPAAGQVLEMETYWRVRCAATECALTSAMEALALTTRPLLAARRHLEHLRKDRQ